MVKAAKEPVGLNIVEATAMLKMAEKLVEALKKNGKSVSSGNHTFAYTVRVDGLLSRGVDTDVLPSFKMAEMLKALLLRYAQQLDEPQEWLESILDIDGALGAVVQLGAESVLSYTVKPELKAIWDAAEAKAKEKFQHVSKKNTRAGNTVVVGGISLVPVAAVR